MFWGNSKKDHNHPAQTMVANSDDEGGFSMKKSSPSKPVSHLKFIEDPEAVTITNEELEALKAELANPDPLES